MAIEYVYYCKNCGIIEKRDVVWATLQQDVDMSFCPKCKVQISMIDKSKTPRLDKGVLRGVKIDQFYRHGGGYR